MITYCCKDCPALETNYDENFEPESYFCGEILDLEITDINDMPEDCPLEKEEIT